SALNCVRSPRPGPAPTAWTASAALPERASARTLQPSRPSRRISAPPTKPEPPVTNAVATAATVSGSLLRSGEVALALLQEDRPVPDEVAHAHLPLGDARERPVTAVVGQPCRAANGR